MRFQLWPTLVLRRPKKSRSGHFRSGVRKSWRPWLEGLETRLAPSCTIGVVRDVLTVDCDNSGTSTLVINDQAHSANSTYTLTAFSVARPGRTIFFGSRAMNFVTLNGGSGTNTYNVMDTGAIDLTTLNTGTRVGGDTDVVNVMA